MMYWKACQHGNVFFQLSWCIMIEIKIAQSVLHRFFISWYGFLMISDLSLNMLFVEHRYWHWSWISYLSSRSFADLFLWGTIWFNNSWFIASFSFIVIFCFFLFRLRLYIKLFSYSNLFFFRYLRWPGTLGAISL